MSPASQHRHRTHTTHLPPSPDFNRQLADTRGRGPRSEGVRPPSSSFVGVVSTLHPPPPAPSCHHHPFRFACLVLVAPPPAHPSSRSFAGKHPECTQRMTRGFTLIKFATMVVSVLNRTFVGSLRHPSMLISAGALLVRTPAAAFSAFSTSSPLDKNHMVRMSSLSADVEHSAVSKTSEERISSLHTVMVHRNRQSAAFREGTQLVFGGSIAATYTEHSHLSTAKAIPMGSVVAVVVSRNPSSNREGKKGPRNGRRSSGSTGKKQNAVPHHTFTADEKESEHRDIINQSQLIGYGVFNPESMYRVRILCHLSMYPGLAKQIRTIRRMKESERHDTDGMTLQYILERKFADVISTRMAINLPMPGVTDTYRLVNGEGDGLSGLAVDILGDSTAIVMSSAAWCEIHKETIMSVLEESLKQHPSYKNTQVDLIWRNTPSRLKQDGYVLETSDDADEAEALSVIATESSVKYLTYPYADGQKTGFYCDQRDNRLLVAEHCRDRKVLDLCCYNGGFALNAMIRGHAASVTGVDSSQEAIDAAVANAKLNGLAEKDISFMKNDIATFMKGAITADEEFDVIVLDPPKLAPSLSSLDKASRKYHALNRDAMNLINKTQGGLLLTCTCSAAMTQKDGGQYFLNVVNGAALSAKRMVKLLSVSGAAPCHTLAPASFPAGAYLTAALFHVSPADV
ncbi:hypothetical protein ACHAWF_005348 [Thalassiosira exigua]